MQNGPKWCKSSCHEVVSEVFATNAPDPPYWTITSCFIAFRTIWVHLGQFVALQDSVQHWPNLCKSSCHEVASEFFATNAPDKFKTGQTCAKVHATKSRRNFSLTRSTPLVSKLMFWCVLYCLDAFGTVWLPYKTRCKTGRSGANVCAMKSCLNFLKRTLPIHPIGP